MTNNENNVVEDIGFIEKIKPLMNRVRISNVANLIVVLVMTVAFSFWSVGWNVNEINFSKFAVNLCLLLFLGVYGLFFGESSGNTYYKTSIVGAYQSIRERFYTIVDKIVAMGYVVYFPDYVPWRYQRRCEAEYKLMLLKVRLFNSSILDLTKEDIERLKSEAIKKVWEEHSVHYGKIDYFAVLSDEQYKVVKDIRNGNVKIDYIEDYSFFLNDSPNDGTHIETNIKNAEKRKLEIIKKQRRQKLTLITLFSVIGAGLAFDQMKGQEGAETFLNLIQRLTTLVTALGCGMNSSKLVNAIDIEVLKYKTTYNEVFYSSMENKTFIPTDYNEKAKEEFEKQEKQKEIENKEEIIHGEESNAIERTE